MVNGSPKIRFQVMYVFLQDWIGDKPCNRAIHIVDSRSTSHRRRLASCDLANLVLESPESCRPMKADLLPTTAETRDSFMGDCLVELSLPVDKGARSSEGLATRGCAKGEMNKDSSEAIVKHVKMDSNICDRLRALQGQKAKRIEVTQKRPKSDSWGSGIFPTITKK